MLALRGSSPAVSNPFKAGDGQNMQNNLAIVKPYLKKELKIDLHTQQQKSMVSALKDPATWLDDRKTKLETIADELADPYYKAIEKYSTLYPMDEAIAMANSDIKALYDIKIRHMELEQPGASVLFQNAVFQNKTDTMEGKILASNVSEPTKESYKRYYKEKRARKKAKKAKKGSQ